MENEVNDFTKINAARRRKKILNNIKRYWLLYFIALPGLLWYIIFQYLPMAGLIIVFNKYNIYKGLSGFFTSPWVGLKNFKDFLSSSMYWTAFKNNVIIALMTFSLTYPLEIILALLLNEIRFLKFKKFAQSVSYMPYFISSMVVVSIITILLDTKGPFNSLITALGGQPVIFLMEPRFFRWIIVISDVWQYVGWGSILFIAALAGIDQEQYEAATVDGASRLRRAWHISLPGMFPIISITLIMNVPSLLGASFEKILLLMNPNTQAVGDVLSTYTYRVGLVQQGYSYGAATGFFTSALSVILLLAANHTAKKLGQMGIW